MKWNLVAVALSMLGLTGAQDTALADSSGENIALGVSYTIEPGPNYAFCTDPGDSVQLTDGVYTDGHFWTELSTVGWQEKTPSIITLDLGTVRPIRGVSFSTAAGTGDVRWPLSIRILTAGEDGKYHEVGDLVQLSAEQHGPLVPTKASDADKYGTHRYWTDRLQTHGRFVSLVVWNEPYTFVDEIEVYAGEPAWVDEPLPGPEIADVKAYAARMAIQKGIRTRLVRDIEALRKATEEEGVPAHVQRDVLEELAAVEANFGLATESGDDFQAVLPLNAWHARVLRTQAWLWRARGLQPLTFWLSNLWDPLPLVGAPDTAAELAVEVHLMRKEYRAAAFNVSNSSDEPLQVAFRLSGLPGGDNPGYVTVHEVSWTDTRSGVPVAAALPEISAEDNLYTVSVPSGMTRQVWLTFHPVDVEPGTYEGKSLWIFCLGLRAFPCVCTCIPWISQTSSRFTWADGTTRIGSVISHLLQSRTGWRSLSTCANVSSTRRGASNWRCRGAPTMHRGR